LKLHGSGRQTTNLSGVLHTASGDAETMHSPIFIVYLLWLAQGADLPKMQLHQFEMTCHCYISLEGTNIIGHLND
jgi:hypothetical protein